MLGSKRFNRLPTAGILSLWISPRRVVGSESSTGYPATLAQKLPRS